MPVKIIQKYFPDLSQTQLHQLEALSDLYEDWNSKVNVISRKDQEHLYERHILHSLAIAKVIRFVPGSKIMDVGTGGGFPGIPLAILFPESQFTLVDSIGKKIMVVDEIGKAIGLNNMTCHHSRAEDIEGEFDFITSRAVAKFDKFIPWIRNKVKSQDQNGLPNGLLALKGGDLSEEITDLQNHTDIFDLKDFFEEEFFETKKIVYVGIN